MKFFNGCITFAFSAICNNCLRRHDDDCQEKELANLEMSTDAEGNCSGDQDEECDNDNEKSMPCNETSASKRPQCSHQDDTNSSMELDFDAEVFRKPLNDALKVKIFYHGV